MSAKTFSLKLSAKATEKLQEFCTRIKPHRIAEMIWKRAFTAQERRKLGNDFAKAHRDLGTVGMWQKVRGGSFERAMLDACQSLGMIPEHEHGWLLRELGELPEAEPEPDCPSWDAQKGCLYFNGKIVRRLRINSEPSNIQLIVEAFEEQGWPSRIHNPLTLGQQQLHETLRFLNKDLKTIKFHAQEGAEAVTWKRL